VGTLQDDFDGKKSGLLCERETFRAGRRKREGRCAEKKKKKITLKTNTRSFLGRLEAKFGGK